MNTTDLLLFSIAEAVIRPHIPTDLPLRERILHAMRYVRKAREEDLFWLATEPVDENFKMRAALAAVVLNKTTTDDESDIITLSLRPLHTLSALVKGVPVNIEAFVAQVEDARMIPLLKLWHEAE